MIKAGMDVARFNMCYFKTDQLEASVVMLRKASKECGKYIGVVVDLIGPSIKTLEHDNEEAEVFLNEGDEVRVSSNSSLKSNFGLIVIDLPDIEKKIKVGGAISINYGNVTLRVEKFEPEEKYI